MTLLGREESGVTGRLANGVSGLACGEEHTDEGNCCMVQIQLYHYVIDLMIAVIHYYTRRE